MVMARLTGDGLLEAESIQSGGRETAGTSGSTESPLPVDAIREIKEEVTGIKSQLPALGLSNSETAEVEADVIQIEAEANRPTPRRQFMRLFLESLRDNLAKATGAAAAAGVVGGVVTIAAAIGRLLGLL